MIPTTTSERHADNLVELAADIAGPALHQLRALPRGEALRVAILAGVIVAAGVGMAWSMRSR